MIRMSDQRSDMAKAKISVTVERSLIRECDRLAQGAKRSHIVENALARWLRDVRRKRLEDEIERYYASLRPAGREEDSEWAELSYRSLGETWK